MNVSEKIKLALRITSNAFDDEIDDLIESCDRDLQIAGIVRIKDDDPLILRARILYAKWHFGYADAGESYMRSYEMLKVSLRLAGDYNV